MKACATQLLLHWLFNKALVQSALVPVQISNLDFAGRKQDRDQTPLLGAVTTGNAQL